jgi:hypothetical protein
MFGLIKKPKNKAIPEGIPLKVEHRIGIQAPAEVIWEILSDIDNWPTWNPTYPKASGKLGIGKQLDLTLALPDTGPRDLAPYIADWVPETQILWTESFNAGMVKTVRFIEIENLGPANCIVSNGEQVDGLLAEIWLHKRRRALKKGYGAMSEALRDKAEALWRERSGVATSGA